MANTIVILSCRFHPLKRVDSSFDLFSIFYLWNFMKKYFILFCQQYKYKSKIWLHIFTFSCKTVIAQTETLFSMNKSNKVKKVFVELSTTRETFSLCTCKQLESPICKVYADLCQTTSLTHLCSFQLRTLLPRTKYET